MIEQFLTTEQVAKLLQLHPFTVLKFIREGKLAGVKIGRVYRIKESDVQEFLESRMVNGGKRAKKAEKPQVVETPQANANHTQELESQPHQDVPHKGNSQASTTQVHATKAEIPTLESAQEVPLQVQSQVPNQAQKQERNQAQNQVPDQVSAETSSPNSPQKPNEPQEIHPSSNPIHNIPKKDQGGDHYYVI